MVGERDERGRKSVKNTNVPMTHKGGKYEDAICSFLHLVDMFGLSFTVPRGVPLPSPGPHAFAVAPSPPSPRSAAQVTSLDLLLCFHAH